MRAVACPSRIERARSVRVAAGALRLLKGSLQTRAHGCEHAKLVLLSPLPPEASPATGGLHLDWIRHGGRRLWLWFLCERTRRGGGANRGFSFVRLFLCGRARGGRCERWAHVRKSASIRRRAHCPQPAWGLGQYSSLPMGRECERGYGLRSLASTRAPLWAAALLVLIQLGI